MRYYNSIAEGYDELHREEQSKKLFIIKNEIKVEKGSKLLDVGCGTGISSDFGCFVAGIDPSIGMIRQNSRSKVLGVAEHLPFKDNSFDYVVSVTSIHNFRNINKSIKEIKRVGREKFIFSVLGKSRKKPYIKRLIEKNFSIGNAIDEGKDTIFFCKRLAAEKL